MKLRVITNSEIDCHKTCARKHWYRYERRLRVRSVPEERALSDGHQAHDFQECWWQPHTATAEELVKPITNPIIRALMVGYDERWSSDAQYWETVAVEQEIYQPFITVGQVQLVLGTKLDGIVVDRRTGALLIREFKTSAYDVTPGSSYWQSIRLNSQIDTYSKVMRDRGTPVVGTLYDVVHKPRMSPEQATPEHKRKWTKEKPATKNKPAEPSRLYAGQRLEDETEAEFEARVALTIASEPEKYYARSVIMRTDDQVDVFEEEIEYFASRMMSAPPHRNTSACMKFNRLCEYHPLCGSYGDESLYTTQPTRHAELERANEVEESGKV